MNEALKDTFKGTTQHLCSCIEALLALDAKGALVPHGVGGHARGLLAAAALRLAALSNANVTLKHVTDPDQLEVGREYWLRDKSTGEAKVSTYQEYGIGQCFFEGHIWTFNGNNQGMRRWDIFGPLPAVIRPQPDFDVLMGLKAPLNVDIEKLEALG